jgi:hypothetical protein
MAGGAAQRQVLGTGGRSAWLRTVSLSNGLSNSRSKGMASTTDGALVRSPNAFERYQTVKRNEMSGTG